MAIEARSQGANSLTFSGFSGPDPERFLPSRSVYATTPGTWYVCLGTSQKSDVVDHQAQQW